MKKYLTIIIILLSYLIIQNGLLGIGPFYKYKVVFAKDEAVSKVLNEYGLSGYQVVSARRATSSEDWHEVYGYEFVFMKKGLPINLGNL